MNKILKDYECKKDIYLEGLQKLHCSCLDVLTDQYGLTQSCISRHVCRRSNSLIDITEARSRAKLKWQHIHPIILLYGCLSSHSTLQQVSYRRCGGSSHTSVDRAGGVKSECFYFSDSLVICKYLLLLMQDIDTYQEVLFKSDHCTNRC